MLYFASSLFETPDFNYGVPHTPFIWQLPTNFTRTLKSALDDNHRNEARTSLECLASTLLYSDTVYYTVILTLNRYMDGCSMNNYTKGRFMSNSL